MKIRILGVSVIALAVFDLMLWQNALVSPAAAPLALRVPPAIADERIQISVGLPVRLNIPSISLDAAIEKVALTADGLMDVPKSPRNTGWYELGRRPGETGSAVIAGHVDGKYGTPAVFANLHRVKLGDAIAVQDDNGAVITFVVRDIRQYDAVADAIDIFSSNDGQAHLNLITCDGLWDKRAKQYTKRLVVFADKQVE